MPIPARLSIVSLGVRDLDTMRAFYRGLGFEPSTDMAEFVCFIVGGVGLGLYGLDALAEEAGGDGDVGDWRGFTLALNVDTKDEVDPVFRAWVDAGARPVHEPVDRPWGGRSGYVADPEGNRWEIAWAPGAAFDERGALIGFG